MNCRSDQGIDVAYRALGLSELRIETLKIVLARRRVTVTAIMDELGVARNTALKHLKALDADGLVMAQRTTHPRGAGPITYWSSDPDRVEDILRNFSDYVMKVSGTAEG